MLLPCGVLRYFDTVGFRQSDSGAVALEDNEGFRTGRHSSTMIEETCYGRV